MSDPWYSGRMGWVRLRMRRRKNSRKSRRGWGSSWKIKLQIFATAFPSDGKFLRDSNFETKYTSNLRIFILFIFSPEGALKATLSLLERVSTLLGQRFMEMVTSLTPRHAPDMTTFSPHRTRLYIKSPGLFRFLYVVSFRTGFNERHCDPGSSRWVRFLKDFIENFRSK